MIPAVGQIEIYPILRFDEITPFVLENEPPRQQCLSANLPFPQNNLQFAFWFILNQITTEQEQALQ